MKYRFFILPLICFILFVPKIRAEDASLKKKKVSVDPYLGQRLYDATKLIPEIKWSSPLINRAKSSPYKTYPSAKKIKLPDPDFNGLSLEDAIKNRRSKRQTEEFSSEPVSIKQLSQLLFAASGMTGSFANIKLRSAPSAGALYPIEIYLVVSNVSGISRGIYHYSVSEHALELIRKGDFRDEIEYAVMDQLGVKDSAVVFIFSAIPNRTTKKYDLRGWRYIYMEVGYISENIYLQAASLGLSTTVMGAFYDDEVNRLLGFDGRKEMALLIQILGNSYESE